MGRGMKKLQTYVLKDCLKALAPAFAALVLIMVAGFCMQLMHEGLDVVRLKSLIPPLLGYCVPLVLPSAFLTAVVITFGRLSADNELIAVKAAGVHLFKVIWPVLALAVALTGVALYFQFELVPRARVSIKTLTSKAFKQILLDQVMLSEHRQFNFKTVFIQYDDYRDGKLRDLLLLKIGSRRPETIITAQSATVHADPDQASVVAFDMENCISLLGGYTHGEAGTMKSQGATCFVNLAPEPPGFGRDRKHLPPLELLRYLRELKARVAKQKPFAKPDKARRELAGKLQLKKFEISDIKKDLEILEQEYDEKVVQERDQKRQIVLFNQQRIKETDQQLVELEPQLLEIVQKISKAREPGESETAFGELVELDRQRKTLQGQIDERKTEIENCRRNIQEAKLSIQQTDGPERQIKRKIRVLGKQKDSLLKESQYLNDQYQLAQDQYDLISTRLRIHKKLAEAVSLFVFALLGIPLAIMVGGRNVMVAFGTSFAVVLLVFYPFLIYGQIAAKAGLVPLVPAIWAGNAIVFCIGLALLVKVLTR